MAEFEKRLACVIKADGGIARGYLIDTCKRIGVNETSSHGRSPYRAKLGQTFPEPLAAARLMNRWSRDLLLSA